MIVPPQDLKLIDLEAREFIVAFGNNLRNKTFANLQEMPLGEIDCVPESLKEIYRFSLMREELLNGALRLLTRCDRSAFCGFILRGYHDAFDVFADGRVVEIPISDEDYCGRK
jgi:hypothetical protein